MGKALKNNFPLKAMFEITHRCNLRCRHCYLGPLTQDKGERELGTEDVFIILEQLAGAGCLNLGLTGGEPFLRKDFFDILEYAKRLGFNIIILTNGTLLTPELADRLRDIGPNKIDLSLHSSNPQVFDSFTQVRGSYARALKAVQLLRERNIEVYVKVTAMTINKDDIVRLRHLAIERFGAHFRLGPTLNPSWDGKKQNLKFRLRPEEVNQIQREIDGDIEIECGRPDNLERKKRPARSRKGQKQIDAEVNHNRLFRCRAARTEIAINPYGEMKLCLDLREPKYQILKGSFAEGWEMLSAYVNNTPPGPTYQCRDCQLAQYCNICPAIGWLECADTSACPPYYRRMALLAKAEARRRQGHSAKDVVRGR